VNVAHLQSQQKANPIREQLFVTRSYGPLPIILHPMEYATEKDSGVRTGSFQDQVLEEGDTWEGALPCWRHELQGEGLLRDDTEPELHSVFAVKIAAGD
jgi:hypothetical protein